MPKYKKIGELIPYFNNPRNNENAVEKVAESIKQFGFQAPIIIDENNVIIAGHTRLKAAELLGLEKVPVIVAENLTEDQARAYRLVDNKTAEFSDWDFEKLAAELENIDLDLSAFDFSFDDWEKPEKQVNDDNFDVIEELDNIVEPTAKVGDVWRLGNHRLICGDSTDAETVARLFDGEQPFCIVTDPPYCSGGFQEAGKRSGSIGTRSNIMIANDTLSTRGYQSLIKSVLKAAGDVGIIYIFTDWRMFINLFDVAESSGFGVRNMIVWNKETAGMGVGWRAQHEIILLGSRSAQKFNPHKAQGNVISCKRTGNINHPTEKPVELLAKIIDVTDFANAIYDPFGGSGTTLIACEELNRRCYIAELDPKYCDVIIKRWETLTGKKAEIVKN